MPRRTQMPLLVALIAATAAFMLVPSALAFRESEPAVGRAFFQSAIIIGIITGFVGLAVAGRKARARSGGLFALLTMIYLVLPAVMAIPVAEAVPSMRFADAWFEMISSFTTTGASVIDLPRRTPDAIHLWRAMAGWMGGLFILAAATALLAPLRLGGFELIHRSLTQSAPGTGVPRSSPGIVLQAHGAVILPAYAALTLALWILLTLSGLPGFDALLMAMSTLSTSGILPRETLGGIGFLPELAIFAFLFIALSRRFLPGSGARRFPIWRDPELVAAVSIIVLAVLFVVARHWTGAFAVAEGENLPAMRRAAWGVAFTALSFLTTTGFISEAWIASRSWSGLTPPGLVLMGLAIMGGGVATTAGGVKLLRLYSLMRLGKDEMDRMLYPSIVASGNEYTRYLATTGARAAWLFSMVFTLTAVAVVALLLLAGMSLETSMIFTVAALCNIGPLVQIAGESTLHWVLLSDTARVILAGAMILGRLEIVVFLALVLTYLRKR